MFPHTSSPFVASAHRAFAVFYTNAAAGDANLMDALVIIRGTLQSCVSVEREKWPVATRRQLEHTTAEIECFFTGLREAVRNTRTFRALPQKDRDLIEHDLFEVNAPVSD